jgi:hypothetical protein
MAVVGVRRVQFLARVCALAVCAFVSGCKNSGALNPNAAGESYCDVISAYASAEDCADFQKQAARETDGNAALNAPNPMNRGDTVNLSLAIAANQPEPQPEAGPSGGSLAQRDRRVRVVRSAPAPAAPASATPAEAAPAPAATETYAPTPSEVVAPMPGHTETFTLTVGEHVKATLDGDEGFQITPRSPATQVVHLGPPYPATLWNWDVTAVHGGVHTLRISTIVQAIDRNGQYHDLVSSPHAFSFTVHVGFWGNVQDKLQLAPTWIKLVTTIVAALTALVVAVSKLRNAVLRLLGLKAKKPKAG